MNESVIIVIAIVGAVFAQIQRNKIERKRRCCK